MRSRLVSSVLRFACIVCAWSAPLAAVVATPQTWNPTSAFSVANGNPNGVWTYGWMDTAFTTFTPYTNQSSQSGSSFWYGWGGDFTPSIWLNTAGSTSYGIPTGGLALHPGNGNEPAVLRWTAPVTATVRVAGQFLAGDSGVMQVAVRHNNTVRFSATDAGAFDLTLNVTVGDTVDFAVFGGYVNGNTGLQTTITETITTVPLTTLDSAKIALGKFDAGTVLRISVTGSGDLAPPSSWPSKPDGSLASAASGTYAFANIGATYPNVSGFPAGNGLNNFPGGGANYDHGGTGWPFAGKQTTDTTDPAAIRFGALVGTYSASPTRNDWFLIGTGGTFTVPAGGGTLYAAVNEVHSVNNTGSYTVSLAVAPANDTFAARTAISGTGASVKANTVGGGKESGEPNHAGGAGGASGWWTWTAPQSGIVEVSTVGSSFDTLLGVYTGTAIGSLTTVASDDNSGPSNTSKLTFNAVAGTAYQIAVDGAAGAAGTVVLNLGYAYRFTTFAGTAGTPGATDATGPAARFSGPNDIVVDSSGNGYVGEAGNHTIRKITPAGIVTTLAGAAGVPGTADGTGSVARFRQPLGLALDGGGNLLVADYENHAIRKVTPTGVVTTFAGLAGTAGTANGAAADARFNFPVGLAVDGSGNVFVADAGNHVIRKITTGGTVTTFAGTMGVAGSADGTGSAAKFNQPYRVAIDSGGNLVVADTFNHTLRRITAAGVVTTLAGTAGVAGVVDGAGSAARFNKPYGLVFGPNGHIVVADYLGHTVRMVTPGGVVTTLAGIADTPGAVDGTGGSARFQSPTGIARDAGGTLYVADFGNNTIRRGAPVYAPVIASFSPQTVAAGTSVTITGSNFTAASAVTFNGLAAASFTVTSDGAISASAPTGVTAGAITVVTPAGTATSGSNYTVGSPPTITAFSPTAFAPGMTVAITGTNLGGATAVTLNGTNVASFSVNGAGTQVTFVAPNGVTAGPIAVLTPAGTATSGSNYVVRTAAASSAFGADAGGWTVTSFVDPEITHNYAVNATYAVTHNVGGGNPGGYVSISDPDGTYFYFTAPAAYLGNRSAALGGVLVYDLIYPSGVIDIQTADVIVTGNGQRLVWKRDPAILPTSAWQSVSVPLAPSAQWRVGATNGALASVADFQSVFGNLTGIHLRGEYTNGTETAGIDNVVLALPVPTTPQVAGFSPSTVSTGSTVTLFGGGFTGATAVTFNGTPATSFTVLSDLSISAVVPGGATTGTIAVTTPGGTVTSGSSFTLFAPTTIATVPANGTVVAGSSITLTAQTTGAGPFTYQWRKFGHAISGATNASFTLPAAAMIDAGFYDVAVAPSGGSAVVSAPVQVTVQPAGTPLNAATVVPASTFDALVEYDGADVQFLAGASDGKVYVSGYFSSVGGVPRRGFARLLADGTVDAAFVPAPVDNTVWAVAVQPDGKVLVGGDFYLIGGRSGPGLARLNTDGSLDHSFRPVGLAAGSVYAIALQSDGKMVVGGADFQPGGNVLRLNADGTRDGTFATGSGFDNEVFSLVLQPDGKIVAGGPFNAYNGGAAGRIARLNTDGSRDTAFAPGTGFDNRVFWMARQGDGKIVVAGEFSTFNGGTAGRIARLNPADGSVDTAFAAALGSGFGGGRIDMIVIQNDGKIVAGGSFSSFNGTSVGRIARLLDTGALDTSFAVGTGSNRDVSGLAVVAGGAILAETDGSATFNGVAGGPVVRLSAGGVRDTGYVLPAREPGSVYALVPAPGGKWLIGGDFEFVNGVARNNLARLNANGAPDESFAVGTGFNSGVEAILVQPDGRVVVGGGFTTYNGGACNRLVRLTDTGGLDATFDVGAGFNSTVRALAQQADGKVLVGGWFNTYRSEPAAYLVRLNADGSRDAAFGTPGTGFNNVVHTLVVRPDGDIYAGGNFTGHGVTLAGRIARLNADGTLDTGFAPGVGFDAAVYAVAVQTDGRVVVGGQFGYFNGAATPRIARLNANGTRDESFATAGFSGTVYDVALQADGRIMAAGYIYRYGTDPTDLPSLVRLNADGTRDYGFVLPGVPPYEQIRMFHFTGTGGLIYAGGSTYFPSRATAGVALLGPAVVPAISQQPAGAVALTAGQAGGSLTVTATDAVAYQWRRDGVPIPGAFGQTYVFPTATMGLAGRYDVVVTAASGTVATSAASTVTVAPSAYPASITVDPGFAIAFERELFDASGYPIKAIVALPGGKFVVAGPFSRIGSVPRSGLARFNADGTLDTAWTPAPVAGQIDALAVQSDGKLLLGGTFFRVGTAFRNGLARLNADGTLDTTAFAGPAPGSVQAIAVLPDGKILAGGMFSNAPGGIDRNALARFTAEGVFDATFNAAIAGGSVRALAVQTVGGTTKIVVGGTFATVGGVARGRVARLNADGTLDAAFSAAPTANGADGDVNALAIDSGNGVLVGGAFENFSGTAARALVRLAATDGARDAAFTAAAGGTGFALDSVVYALAVMADGKIAVGSNDTEFNGNETGALIRLTAAGALDSTGTTYVNAPVYALAAPRSEDGGGVILGGSFSYFYEYQTPRLARVTSGWARDPAVVHSLYVPATVHALAHGLSGDVYVGGNFTHVGGQPRSALARLLPGGAVDAAFNAGDSGFPKGSIVTGLAPVGDGRMTVIGSFYSYRGSSRVGLVRILPDGVTDSAFNVGYGLNQPPAAVLALPGGRVLVAGPFTSFKGTPRNGLAAILPDGSLDTSYLNPVAPIPGGDLVLARQNDDRVLIGGSFTSFAGTPANRLVRLHANGVLDTDFTAGVGTGPSHAVNALAVLPDGKILAAGGFTSWGENTAYRFIARLTSGGVIDGTFVPPSGSFGSAGFGIQSVVAQADGRILVRGLSGLGISNTFGFGRLAAGGAADATFAVSGIASISSTDRPMLLLGDGSLLVGVSTSLISDTAGPRHGLARLAPASAPTIAAHPQSQVAIAGQTVTFSVTVNSVVAPTYQWRRNTVAITGATSDTLVLPAVNSGAIGTYDVLVTVGGGTAIPSNPAFLAIGPVASAGAVERGGSVSFAVDVTGLPTSTFQWQRGGVNLDGETGATLVVTNANDSSVGTYRVIVSNSIGSVTSGGAPLVLLKNSLLALSARHRVPPRGEVSASFTIQGSQPKRVLIRGAGPALAALDIGDRLTDPQLRLYGRTWGDPIATNDDWGSVPANPVGATPVFSSGSKDAAIEITLGAGTYTAVLNGAGGAGGVAFLQIYDRDADAKPRLTMLTTRGHVGTGENVVTVGFTVGGTESRKLLFRSPGWRLIQPTENSAPLPYESGILRDPMIGVYNSSGAQLGFNDDWDGTSQELAAVAATGAQPFFPNTYDATVLLDLAPGNYTAQLLGYSSQTGESLLEIFEVDAYLAATAPPAFTWVPSDQPVLPGGGGAVFSATAAGKPGVSFQWRRNGTPIPGATRNLLDFPTVTDADVATAGVPNVYDVVATNTAGSATSPGRRLRVLPEFHSADTNRDSRIGLFELTRVIELYNHRAGGVRTGEYRTQAGTEDGYRPGSGSIAVHHSADWNRDGRIGLDELLRVIELYNVSEGEPTVRTGRYVVSGATEDGFAPAATPLERGDE